MTTAKGKSKAKRINYTIPQGIEAMLIQVARDMGTEDLKEALNFILWDVKRTGYKFKNGLRVLIPSNAQPQPITEPTTQPVTAPIVQPITQSVSKPETIEIDPVLQRLINAGIEDF